MKGFELFISKYPPDHNLRKPTAEMLAQFQGKVVVSHNFRRNGTQFKKRHVSDSLGGSDGRDRRFRIGQNDACSRNPGTGDAAAPLWGQR